ncbi:MULTISPECIES: FecR domain-containing protein [Candidatus Ichthyocystis]|uniref:Type II secretion system protein D n=1 Tax=Candidatus Ichthyocystis hellenicum TaxID=1561003 RepID=A0A0S4M0F6_9BURK|nr:MULTISPECIES: FecR domain-containing protein [Ichthyocystis]CUT17289.1 type II secretion system protein D [Candidatus Ichthyocystis hellenicum]
MKKSAARNFLPLLLPLLTYGCVTNSANNNHLHEENTISLSRNQDNNILVLKKLIDKNPDNNELREIYWDKIDRFAKRSTQETFQLIKTKQYDKAKIKIEEIKKIYPAYPQLSNIVQFLKLSKDNDQTRSYGIKLFNSQQYEQAYEIFYQLLYNSPDDDQTRMWLEKTQSILFDRGNKEVNLAKKLEKKISVDYQSIPLKTILKTLSDITNINFFFDQDARLNDNVTVISKDNSIKDTLSIICLSHNLRMKILNENSIIFFPDLPNKIRKYETLAVRVFHITKGNITKIAENIRTILHVRDISIDDKTGYLIVRATPDTIGAVEHLISIEDQETPEVELDLEVLEVAHSDAHALGIEWPSNLSFSVISTGTTAATTLDKLLDLGKGDILVNGLTGSIAAKESFSHSSLLADPRIRVRDNEKAEIQIGEKLPLKNSTTTSTGIVSDSISYVDVGLKLNVQPKISFDQKVTINLKLEVSSMISKQDLGNGLIGYDIGTRNVSTTLQLMNNETQILGGLLRNSNSRDNSGLPGISKIPLLGYLFGKKSYNTEQNEIILAITPHIIHPVRTMDKRDQNFFSGTEEHVQLKSPKYNISPLSSTQTPSREDTKSRSLPPAKNEHNSLTMTSYDHTDPVHTNNDFILSPYNHTSPLNKTCSVDYHISDSSKIVLKRTINNSNIWDLMLVNIANNTKGLLINIKLDRKKSNFVKLLPGSLAILKEPTIKNNKDTLRINISSIDGFYFPRSGLAAQIEFDNAICNSDIKIDEATVNGQE